MDNLTLIDEFIYFTVYDSKTYNLLYTKYNFLFESYKKDFKLDSTDKGVIFKHFLNANGEDWTKPTTVKPELVKYFGKINTDIINYINKYGWIFHDNYMQIKNPNPNVSFTDICKEQFMMRAYTDEEYRRIQDYYYNDKDNHYYTKYNFNFEEYQKDFNVYYKTTNKLVVFTDFIIRCLTLSSTAFGTYGYGLYEPFVKYFYIDDIGIMNYMVENGVSSDYEFVRKNVTSIDYLQYKEKNADLKSSNLNTIDELKEHYILWGQFERRIVPIKTQLNTFEEEIISSVGSVYTTNKDGSNELGTGFLYNDLNGSDNIYLVTCYHLNAGSANINTIMASFEVKDINSIETKSTTALFRIIGYDIYADILVALYDPTIDYNIINKVDMSPFKRLIIDFEHVLKPSDPIYCLGNLGFENNRSLVEGTVIDPTYNGNFDTFALPIPDSILIELYATKGLSGAPLFIKDANGKPQCVGMMNGYIDDLQQYSVGINGAIFNSIINNITRKWDAYSVYFADDIIRLNYYIKNGLTKRWLGIICSYYHRSLSNKISRSLNNFPYTGGLVIHDFIIGFNYAKRAFINNPIELSEQNTIQINTPLLKTKIYKKFIDCGRNPIVLKSITYLNGIRSEFSKSYIGKYSNQVSYSRIMYGLAPMGNKRIDRQYISNYEYYYPNMLIEFYYYNGREWVLGTDTVGGNTTDNYNTYQDPLGYKYYQHQVEFPFILIPYLDPYMDTNGESISGVAGRAGIVSIGGIGGIGAKGKKGLMGISDSDAFGGPIDFSAETI